MICSNCKKNEANVHFSGIINGKAVKLDLCEACSQTAGPKIPFFGMGLSGLAGAPVSFPSLSPILTEFMEILSQWPGKRLSTQTARACPRCRWNLRQFQKTGKMGCPACYTTFETEAREILKKINGNTLHKGKKVLKIHSIKTKPREPAADSLPDLKSKLEKAVREERYEDAAGLRDRIKDAEKRPWNS